MARLTLGHGKNLSIARLGQFKKNVAVTHPSNNLATPCFTSVISRELVYQKFFALA